MNKHSTYTKERLDFLRVHYQNMLIPELTRAFNKQFNLAVTESSLHAALNNHKIRCGRKTGNPPGRSLLFTPEQVAFIKKHYSILNSRELAEAINAVFGLNISQQQIRSFTRNHHVLSGRTGCFEKGHISWNKGTKGKTGRNKTSFVKGNKPLNLKAFGSERINVYGYTEVKVDEINPYTGHRGYWRLKHVLIWEKANGPVPDGHVVIFRDQNKLNCIIENLVAVSHAVLVRLNQDGFTKMPAELKPSVIAMAQLKTNLFERMREVGEI